MADYWKSLPRKFCEFCKCWLTENKPSIEFHERGKRHQENVKKRISELRKKGQKEYQEQKKFDSDFKKMEEAALKAYENDLKGIVKTADPSMAEPKKQVNKSKPPAHKPRQKNEKRFMRPREPHNLKSQKVKIWLEAATEEGQTYYWNSETGESSWEEPKEGYLSLLEQQCNVVTSVEPLQVNGSNAADLPSSASGVKKSLLIEHGPRVDPYGQWVTVTKVEKKPIDLQLPVQKEKIEIKPSINITEPKIKFKEKTFSSSDMSIETTAGATFKKRKINEHLKKNIRQKVSDD